MVKQTDMPTTVKVGDIAKREIVSIDRGKSVIEAVRLMFLENIGSVVVSDAGRYVGIVTERDILRKLVLNSLEASDVRVGDIMSSPLITVQSAESLGRAALIMTEKRIRRILVVENDKITGIVTERDLQKATLDLLISLANA